MKIEILIKYIDYCNNNNKVPELQELIQWKEKYTNSNTVNSNVRFI